MKRLNIAAKNFTEEWEAIFSARHLSLESIEQKVDEIIANVREKGDEALYAYTKEFDRVETPVRYFGPKEIRKALEACEASQRRALEKAASRIRLYHEKMKPVDAGFTDETGFRLGVRYSPIERAGLYIPGGRAAYPSTVLMSAIPAQVAGVAELVVVAPAPGNLLSPLVLAGAGLLGIEHIHAIGGAQAIAALAFGTETVPKVDLVAGPGNRWVAAAKKRVFGTVGIDALAGPTEVLIVADSQQNPRWIAWDILAQAEHDETAQSILVCDSEAFADKVMTEMKIILDDLPRQNIARQSLDNYGAVICVASLKDQAPDLINRVAPEHLQLLSADNDAIFARTNHAGAAFFGAFTPEALGDYIAGPSHILPTAQSGRHQSGLAVETFMKKTSLIEATPQALEAVAAETITLARAEGLEAHAQSVQIRLDDLKQ